MKKSLLWILVLLMNVLLVAVFSSGGCRRVEEVTGEPEEALDESGAEEMVKETTKESKIAFISDRDNRDGSMEIYIMNIDGSEQTRLTDVPQRNYEPYFSPDGSKIVSDSGCDGNREIYIMNVGESGQVNLTNNPADDYAPSFSP